MPDAKNTDFHFRAQGLGLTHPAKSTRTKDNAADASMSNERRMVGIDGDRSRRFVPESVTRRGEDRLLGIDAIAETCWQIHCEPSSAWAHQVDLRPFREPFCPWQSRQLGAVGAGDRLDSASLPRSGAQAW